MNLYRKRRLILEYGFPISVIDKSSGIAATKEKPAGSVLGTVGGLVYGREQS